MNNFPVFVSIFAIILILAIVVILIVSANKSKGHNLSKDKIAKKPITEKKKTNRSKTPINKYSKDKLKKMIQLRILKLQEVDNQTKSYDKSSKSSFNERRMLVLLKDNLDKSNYWEELLDISLDSISFINMLIIQYIYPICTNENYIQQTIEALVMLDEINGGIFTDKNNELIPTELNIKETIVNVLNMIVNNSEYSSYYQMNDILQSMAAQYWKEMNPETYTQFEKMIKNDYNNSSSFIKLESMNKSISELANNDVLNLSIPAQNVIIRSFVESLSIKIYKKDLIDYEYKIYIRILCYILGKANYYDIINKYNKN